MRMSTGTTAVLLGLLVGAGGTAFADSTNLTVTADAFARWDTASYIVKGGTAGDVDYAGQETAIAIRYDGPEVYQNTWGLFEFDPSVIPDDVIITNATINIVVLLDGGWPASANFPEMALFNNLGGWSEAGGMDAPLRESVPLETEDTFYDWWDAPMPFCFGYHPYFRAPIGDGRRSRRAEHPAAGRSADSISSTPPARTRRGRRVLERFLSGPGLRAATPPDTQMQRLVRVSRSLESPGEWPVLEPVALHFVAPDLGSCLLAHALSPSLLATGGKAAELASLRHPRLAKVAAGTAHGRASRLRSLGSRSYGHGKRPARRCPRDDFTGKKKKKPRWPALLRHGTEKYQPNP